MKDKIGLNKFIFAALSSLKQIAKSSAVILLCLSLVAMETTPAFAEDVNNPDWSELEQTDEVEVTSGGIELEDDRNYYARTVLQTALLLAIGLFGMSLPFMCKPGFYRVPSALIFFAASLVYILSEIAFFIFHNGRASRGL